MKKKRLLLLGGERLMCEVVKEAQKMGYWVGVTDWYSMEKSPAKQMADQAFYVSTADVEAVVTLIKEENIVGILTGFTDTVLPFYAKICEKAGLPCYGTKEQFEIFTNKQCYKKLCREFSIPVINEYKISFPFQEEEMNQLFYPVLVKPSDNSGGRGVKVCDNQNEFVTAYQQALKLSKSGQVLVEHFVDTGKEVTVFLLFQEGEILLSGMGNRHVKKNQEDAIALPVAYSYPSIYLDGYVKEIYPNLVKMLKSIHIENGMMFMQCMVENGSCVLYDIGYRLTGSLEFFNMEACGGFHPLQMMIYFAMTGRMAETDLKEKVTPFWKKYGSNVSFLMKPGCIAAMSGIEEIKKLKGVLRCALAYVEGETLPPEAKGQLRQIVLRVLGTAETKEELLEQFDEIYNCFSLLSDKNENLLLEGLDVGQVAGEVKSYE